MTRTFLKKKFSLKKCFWSETEVKTDSGNAKGDSTNTRIHPSNNCLPQKVKIKGIRDCSQ